MSDELELEPEIVVEPTEVKEPEVTEVDNSAQAAPKRETRQERADRLEKVERSYNELRSFSDKRYTEAQRQTQALQEQLKFFEPYKEALAKAIEEKKQQELKTLYEQNPLEAQKRIAEDAAKQREQQLMQQYAPMQEQLQKVQDEQFVSQVESHLETTYGKQMYEAAKIPMGQILETVGKENPQAAELLARNPDALFNMAFGQVAIAELKRMSQEKKTATQVGQQNQNRATQFANGVAKPRSQRSQDSSFNDLSLSELTKLHYAELAKENR